MATQLGDLLVWCMQSALQRSRIVPDVFDAVDVDNEVEMSVEFPTGFKVANGNDIPKEKARSAAALPITSCQFSASCSFSVHHSRWRHGTSCRID